ncbi:MAG: hypothetical protein IKP67_02615 [Spirochaetales bacterium]|jgi:hypothetical protein|nr:hypothetical protein [Spirochaetales bacterium]
MKPRSMIIFLILLMVSVTIGLICGIVEDYFWYKNLPQASSMYIEKRIGE